MMPFFNADACDELEEHKLLFDACPKALLRV